MWPNKNVNTTVFRGLTEQSCHFMVIGSVHFMTPPVGMSPQRDYVEKKENKHLAVCLNKLKLYTDSIPNDIIPNDVNPSDICTNDTYTPPPHTHTHKAMSWPKGWSVRGEYFACSPVRRQWDGYWGGERGGGVGLCRICVYVVRVNVVQVNVVVGYVSFE